MAEKDPYQVLGVSPSASDDEIKKAYRTLARKYHPDKYQDSDLKDLASEKMKEVNAAYESIQQMRANGGAEGGNSFGNGYQYSTDSASPLYAEIRRYINAGQIALAEQKLYAVSEADRGAEWNFLMGCVVLRRGYYMDAQNYLDRACAMDPRNVEYQNTRDMLRRRAGAYGNTYRTTNNVGGFSGCDMCQTLICADCCCECMGGDLIRCC